MIIIIGSNLFAMNLMAELNKVIEKCLSLSLARSQQMDRYICNKGIDASNHSACNESLTDQDFNLILLHRVFRFAKKFNSNKWNCVKEIIAIR